MSAIEGAVAPFFDDAAVPPPEGRREFSLSEWKTLRGKGIAPAFHSGFGDDDQHRLEFLEGARLMGYLADEMTLKPQQLAIADTLSLPKSAYAIEIPRRASKTTSIFLTLLGRCALRPRYKVTFSAQSGLAGSAQFLEWVRELDDATPPDDGDLPPWLRNKVRVKTKREQRHSALFGEELATPENAHLTGGRGFRVMKGEVNKGLYFDNGSSFVVLRPDAKAYRGKAADVSWIDEAQEIPVDEGAGLLAAIRPLQDTRPGASIILSGTAGEARAGIFWEYLERGRNTDEKIGILDYAAPEDTPWEIIEDEDSAMHLLAGVHPGINTLTTEETMRERWHDLGKPQWAREYLSIWPEAYGVSAIIADQWAAGTLAKKLTRPPRVAFGFDIAPGGTAACIVAAWRNSRGVAYIEIVQHEPGTSWMGSTSQHLSKTYRGSTLAYDDISEGKATATEMQVLRPKPRLRQLTYREIAAGCVQFMRDLERGKLKHFDQAGLNQAAAIVTKREVRSDQGVWLWSKPLDGGDITPIVAATKALRNWDQYFAGKTAGTTPIMGD